MSEMFDDDDEFSIPDGPYLPVGHVGNILYCLKYPVDPSKIEELKEKGVELFEETRDEC